MKPNEKAFLDMIAHSEIGAALLAVSDDGYNVLVGSTADAPLLFDSYADHPRIRNAKFNSTAAGRYQVLLRYFISYKALLNLGDINLFPEGAFSHAAQDAIAMQYLKECRALDDINAGNFESAVSKCAHIWASLPGAGYGQHENKLAALQQAYVDAGGVLA